MEFEMDRNERIKIARELVTLAKEISEHREREAFWWSPRMPIFKPQGLDGIRADSFDKLDGIFRKYRTNLSMTTSSGLPEEQARRNYDTYNGEFLVFLRDGKPVSLMNMNDSMLINLAGLKERNEDVKKAAARWLYVQNGCDDDRYKECCKEDFGDFAQYLEDGTLDDLRKSRAASVIVASNAHAKTEILKCAMYSYYGTIIYRKWDKKQKRYVRRSHVVVPVDCGTTSKGNEVLFAEDLEDHMQVKQFIIDQILDFFCNDKKKKRKTVFPIRLDNIKKYLGVDERQVKNEIAAGIESERRLRVAQEVYEFSGCEANMYCDSKKKDPYSYNVVYDDGRGRIEKIATSLVAYLTDSQKELVKHFTDQRAEGLSFGNYFNWGSNGRCYFQIHRNGEIQDISKIDDEATKEIYAIIDKMGYVCPDYSMGHCYRKEDTTFSDKNPPKVLTLIKKALRKGETAYLGLVNRDDKETNEEKFKRLSKAFNERSSGTLKRKGNIKLLMCLTHDPEDVAGMSTDRDWGSCYKLPTNLNEIKEKDLEYADENEQNREIYKDYYGLFGCQKMEGADICKKYNVRPTDLMKIINRIDDKITSGGSHYDTALKQVKYGGMVAYLIREDDTDIARPFARIAIKRFENDDGGFAFEAEKTVYGDAILADSCDFRELLESELAKSNQTTMKGDSTYHRNDADGYTDTEAFSMEKDLSLDQLCKSEWGIVLDSIQNSVRMKLTEQDLDKIIAAHQFPPPKGLFKAFEKKFGELSRAFMLRHKDIVDMDEYNVEHGIELEAVSKYKGEAPKTVAEMTNVVHTAMDDAKYSDDYGNMAEDGSLKFSGTVDAITLQDIQPLPFNLNKFVKIHLIGTFLRYYYINSVLSGDQPEVLEKYPNFALFEEGYRNYEFDEDLQEDVNTAIQDGVGEQNLIGYDVTIAVNLSGFAGDADRAVFALDGKFTYRYAKDESDVAYENTAVINTDDAGWQTKLRDFCEDLFDQIPSFYEY